MTEVGFENIASYALVNGVVLAKDASGNVLQTYQMLPMSANSISYTGAVSSISYGSTGTINVATIDVTGAKLIGWTTFEPLAEAFWTTMGSTGTPIVPICQTGWDTRPRIQRPPSFVKIKPHFGESAYVVAPSPAQLTAHLQAAVSYVTANPTICPSKAIIIYSWDECDEGGNALIPSYGGASPNTANITACGAVAW